MTVLKMPTAANPGHELLLSALAQLGKAAKAINLDPGMHRFLQQPERTLIVALPVTMDDGRLEVFTGYRVQHSTRRGPGKGGIRFQPSVTLEEAQGLAMLMTFNALSRTCRSAAPRAAWRSIRGSSRPTRCSAS